MLADKTQNAKDFVVRRAALERHPTHHEERKRTPLEPRWQDDQAPRLRHQPDLPLAGREGVQPGVKRESIVALTDGYNCTSGRKMSGMARKLVK